MPEIIDSILSVMTTRILPKEKVSLAVYFADFNVFIIWPKNSPCVAQSYKQWTFIIIYNYKNIFIA